MKVWRVVLAALVIFLAGAVAGAAAARLLQGRPASVRPSGPPWAAQRTEMMRLMQRELALTREQHEQLRRIFEDSRDRMNREWRRESQSVREELSRVLTPEQRRRWQEIQRNRANRRQETTPREEWRRPEGRKPRNQGGSTPVDPASPANGLDAKADEKR